ncbi:MAG: IS1380 family transposase [Gemmatimonadota bacterium]|nr:MAG: IS1380 family transposase [Gemmatimonadota bacterium]
MTECSESGAGVKGESGPGVEQITFSFGEEVKPTLRFDAGSVTCDAGLAALRELDERLGLTELAASRIEDLREPDMVVHPVRRLLRETIYAYAAGYEDMNDHTPLRADEWFRELAGPINMDSVNPKRHEGLASEPTLSRLLGARKLDTDSVGFVHVEQFGRVVENAPPDVVTFDIDGYDAETFGGQQLSLFNGYYDEHMYYPLTVTAAEYGFAVAAKLRPGNAAAGEGAASLLRPLFEYMRGHFPNTRIRLRGDSGFMDPEVYRLCEEFGVEYEIRLRLNQVLKRLFEEHLVSKAKKTLRERPGEAWALYHETTYKAGSWKKARRIVMKLQHDPWKGSLERYVIVTSSRRGKRGVWKLYEHRAQCEQRIDELKNHLRAEKFSCCTFEANAFKLHLVVMAHNLFAAARVMLPAEHALKRATVARLRIALVKCAATLRRTARRLWMHASRTWPYRELLADCSRRFVSGPLAPTPVWNTG